jgi:Zn finger protein HypA/HybF involved in hydrogenase expression
MDLANYCEAERKVETYEVYLKCCNCNCLMNFIKPVDTLNNSDNKNNTHHVYECPRCKVQTIKDIKYPFIKYVY